MVTRDPLQIRPLPAIATALPPDGQWRRVALVFGGTPARDVLEAVREIARRDGGQIVLYDLDASAGLTSPYPPGTEGWLPNLLDEAGMHRIGRGDLATLAHDLARENLFAGIYLPPKSNASDLPAFVAREKIELVVVTLPSRDPRNSRIGDARLHAHLLLASPGTHAVYHAPSERGRSPEAGPRVRWPYLLIVLGTYILARGRNRA